MFVTNWISTTKIQKISEITNFFRHYFLSRTEVLINKYIMFYISFSLHILPTFIERGGSFLVSNSYPELVGVGMLPYLTSVRDNELYLNAL